MSIRQVVQMQILYVAMIKTFQKRKKTRIKLLISTNISSHTVECRTFGSEDDPSKNLDLYSMCKLCVVRNKLQGELYSGN